MKKTKNTLILLALWMIPLLVSAQQTENPEAQQMLSKSKSNFFIENKGQWPAEVRYLARIGGMNAWITNAGVVYDYYKISRDYKAEETMKLPPHEKDQFEREHTGIKGQVVEMLLEGANKDAASRPSGIQEGYYNYFIGNDPTKWASFVRLYNEVLIQDIYPGIDIRYYFDNGLIRYDYIAKPGADLAQINLKINGTDGYKINEKGELTLKTCIGKITHGKLYAYQQVGGNKTEVACSFVKSKDGQIGVYADNYNPALALVIDPLIYSTFIGGSGNEGGGAIAIDVSGNIYITGWTLSTSYPTSSGAYDVSHNGSGDVFVTKLNSSGSSLVYSTLIGGSSDDCGISIVLDGSGNTFLTGYTLSTTFPTSSGAYDVSQNGNEDVFVTKLNSSGSSLGYSTFIGGNDYDLPRSIALDASGNTYITGSTYSTTFPTSSGAYDVSHNGSYDVFVTKLNSSGSSLGYSTFIGGSNQDNGYSIAVDASGNTYITGYTQSTTFPTSSGAYDVSHNGSSDVFVTKLNSSGSSLGYSTFIGGSGNEGGGAIAIDASGNTYITGSTGSTLFPTSSGAYDVSHNGIGDVFVTKLNSSGSSLGYSTFIGGSSDDVVEAIAVDAIGNSYLIGRTYSTSYPTTSGAYDVSHNGNCDVFVTKLNSSGSSLGYSTFIGGGDIDWGSSIAVDASGNTYITGSTTSTTFPTTSGAYDASHNGGDDVFVTKIFTLYQSFDITFNNTTGTSTAISCTKGGGTKRAIFVKKTAYGLATPSNGTTYTASTTFGSGTEIGTTGWYCVYNDTGSTVTISGLTAKTTYRAMVCDYLGTTGSQIYNTDSVTNNPKNFVSTYAIPTTQATNVSFSNLTNTTFTVSCTKGNGSKRAFFMLAGNSGSATPVTNIKYTADTIFGSGTQIGSTGWYCIYNDTGKVVNVKNLTPNKDYRVMVSEYNGSVDSQQYNINTATYNPANQFTDYSKPTIQASNIKFSSASTSSFILNWTNGNGTARAIFVKRTTAYTKPAPAKYTTYTANTVYGSGSQIGTTGWYCVYNGTGTTVTVTGLTPDSTLRVMVCEYHGGTGRENYLTDVAAFNPNQAKPMPGNQATNIIFSNITENAFTVRCTKGNGTKRAFFMLSGNSGNAVPVNNDTYTPNSAFGSGSQIGSTGWYCIYNDTGNTVNVTNLNPNTTYRVMVCDYNGSVDSQQYNINTATGNPANQITDYSIPTIQASNLILSGISPTSFSVNWTNGNGANRVVFISPGSSGNVVLSKYSTYIANDTFGKGSQEGSWYCVYNGNGNNVTINGLIADTNYQIMVCEYNGTAGRESYNLNGATSNPANYYPIPSIQSNSIVFINPTSVSINASWTLGNGIASVVFVSEGSSGSAVPQNNTTYIANISYGSGTQIGSSGWFCVFNGAGSSVSVNNLKPNTSYVMMVCDYNGSLYHQQYNTYMVTGNPATFKTLLDTQFICMVTVDTNLWKNSIVWEKPTPQGKIAGYKILKESSLNIYTEIGTVPYTGSPYFVDLGSVPESHGDKYKVVVYDTGGNVSNPGFFHKTMNLIISKNGNTMGLSWDAYVDEGKQFVPLKYYIFRGTEPAKLQLYDSISSSFTTYNDNNIFSLYYYLVAVKKEGGCMEYRGSGDGWSFSNRKDNASLITINKPAVQASDINFSNITSNSASYTFTRGDGIACLVLFTDGTTPYPPLIDNTTYAANSQIGTSGWYCRFNGTNNSDSLTGLNPGTFKMMVCEYNGTPGYEKYNTDPATKNPNTFSIVGIKEQGNNNPVIVYPNPFTQSTTISFPNDSKQPYNLRIFDLSGKVVREIQNIRENQVVVMKGDLSVGLYYFELVGDEIYRGRFVVE